MKYDTLECGSVCFYGSAFYELKPLLDSLKQAQAEGSLRTVDGATAIVLIETLLEKGAAETPVRQRLLDVCRSQLGNTDPTRYWLDVMPGRKPPLTKSWCQAFQLWALHQVGLLKDVHCEFGGNFLSDGKRWRLEVLTEKGRSRIQPGDIAWFSRNQHHAFIVEVRDGIARLIQGNGVGRKVTESHVELDAITMVFSLDRAIEGAKQ